MANTIKFKRASGSDPSASDLAIGEPGLRTDTAELFFKKDDGTVAKVSGGGGGPNFKYLELRNAANDGAASYPANDFTLVLAGTTTAITPVAANTLIVSVSGVIQKPNAGTSTSGITGFIVDGSRFKTATNLPAAPDFIVYQESGGIGEPSDNTVTSAKIVDGTIVNADINASAAIAGTKISPDFGSQNLNTTGNLDVATISTNGEDLYLSNGTLIASDTDGAFSDRTGSNIDHIWHKEDDNTWVFNSDTTYKATTGTSKLRCAGIDFGDSNAAADILDEYEEGTWTPQVRFGDSTSGISYTSLRAGSYTRVGKVVTVHFAFKFSDKGSNNGNGTIHGLPFGVAHVLTGTTIEASGVSSFWNDVADNSANIVFAANDNDFLEMRNTVGAEDDTDIMTGSKFQDNTSLRGSITYFTNT